MKLSISVCTYKSGDFEVLIRDPETGEEVQLNGNQKLDDKKLELITRLAPACVWTTYERDGS